jgi:hypothetical protein
MQIHEINLYDLKNHTLISPIRCDTFAEAAAVCLHQLQHPQGVTVKIEGTVTAQFELVWEQANAVQQNSFYDLDEATENGAYCLAIWVIEKLTPHHVVRKAPKGTGVDFWLYDKNNLEATQPTARLEVSGILEGTKKQIQARLRTKEKQSQQSDDLGIPVYIIIVEFSTPFIKIKQR